MPSNHGKERVVDRDDGAHLAEDRQSPSGGESNAICPVAVFLG